MLLHDHIVPLPNNNNNNNNNILYSLPSLARIVFSRSLEGDSSPIPISMMTDEGLLWIAILVVCIIAIPCLYVVCRYLWLSANPDEGRTHGAVNVLMTSRMVHNNNVSRNYQGFEFV
jgi:hypothetical protein